jgi:hypothetical protein
MPDDDAIPRSVIAEQAKDRLTQDILAGSLSASLAGSWQDPAPETPRAAAPDVVGDEPSCCRGTPG